MFKCFNSTAHTSPSKSLRVTNLNLVAFWTEPAVGFEEVVIVAQLASLRMPIFNKSPRGVLQI